MRHAFFVSSRNQLAGLLASADVVPDALTRTVLFAVYEAKARKNAIVDEPHLLLGALREIGRGAMDIDPDVIRKLLPVGSSSDTLCVLSGAAKKLLLRSSAPSDLIIALNGGKCN